MGGHGNKMYEYIEKYLHITNKEYEFVWNELIFKDKSQLNKFNGIWSKIAFQSYISHNIHGVLSKSDIGDGMSAAKSTAISLIIFCLDAIAGDVYVDFYSWLNKYNKKESYSMKELGQLYEVYINENGVMKRFIKLFEGMIDLNLVGNYLLLFTRKAKKIDKISQHDRGIIMSKVKQIWESSSDIEKSHIIGKYYYKLHRNLFIHSGQTPITGLTHFSDSMGQESENIYSAVAFYPEIDLVSGEILGNELDHLIKLLKLSLARKIETMLKQASLK